MSTRCSSIMVGLLWLFHGGVSADEVTDLINEALSQYQAGKLADASTSLGDAMQLIQQRKGQHLESFLPAALAGWSAQAAESVVADQALFGGGISAQRTYNKDPAEITIQILGDSPMLQGLMAMFASPMFTTVPGQKIQRIAGYRARVHYSAARQSGEITIMVDRRFMVSVKGREVSEDQLLSYAKILDLKGLEQHQR